jgi:hypothetical protein
MAGFFFASLTKIPIMNLAKLDKLFEEYEIAFDRLDVASIAKNYADTFMSAGPKAAIAMDKKEFFQKTAEAGNFYKSIGQKEGKIISKEVLHISNEYCLVTVHWAATFEKTGDEWIPFDVSYLVSEIHDEMKIILFISHEDEEEALKRRGLLPQASENLTP